MKSKQTYYSFGLHSNWYYHSVLECDQIIIILKPVIVCHSCKWKIDFEGALALHNKICWNPPCTTTDQSVISWHLNIFIGLDKIVVEKNWLQKCMYVFAYYNVYRI